MEDILNITLTPEELIERPPTTAKIVKIIAKEEITPYQQKPIINIHIYAIDQDNNDFIHHIIYKYSNRKNSKFGQFVLKVSELLKNAEEIPKPIKLKDLIGCVFEWEFKERKLGNVKASFWLPVKYLGKEPVTLDEEQKVEQFINSRTLQL